MRVIPNGVDTERFRPNREARATLRSQLGIPSGAPVCGIVAALRPEKNHALFLQAAVGIRATNPDTRFLIVGDGPQRARLESLSAEFGISDAVAFLGTRGDVAELLSALDVFLLTSHNEANPVSILEALAVGVPVVATRVGSVPTTVIDGQTGFLADPGNAQQVAEYVLRILNTPGLAVTLGANGRANVEQHWSLDRMVNGYEELIEEIYRSKTTVRRTGADSACGEPLSVVG